MLPRLPDLPGTHKPAQTLLVRRKQPGLCNAGWVHHSVPQKVIPCGTPRPPSPLLPSHPRTGCHLSFGLLLWHQPWQKPAAAPQAPAAAPAPCQPGLQQGDWELPEPRKPRQRGLSYHPSRADRWAGGDHWKSEPRQPPEIRAACHSTLSRGGLQGNTPPDKTPLRSPGTHAGAAVLSSPWPRGCCAHPQPGPLLQLPQALSAREDEPPAPMAP